MLSHLIIDNVAVIEHADIEFESGVNVLTGETGAGKSIIIDSINAIIGERTSREIVRSGSASARIAAEFVSIGPAAESILCEYGIEAGDGQAVIQRTVSSDGKSTCRINGQPVTSSMLRALGNELISICGQHDSQKLLQKSSHIRYIDALSGLEPLLEEYRASFKKRKEIEKELDSVNIDESDKLRRLEFLDYQINEIASADVRPGESEELAAQKKKIQNKEKILSSLYEAKSLISGDDSSPGLDETLYSLSSCLSGLAEFSGEYSSYIEDIDNLRYELADVLDAVTGDLLNDEEDYVSIDAIEMRLDVLYRLKKKYGRDETEILRKLEEMKAEKSGIERSDERIKELTEKLSEAEKEVLLLAEKLSAARKKAALAFEKAVKSELRFLKMDGADFEVRFEETEPGNDGTDSVEFYISPNPGQEPKPLGKTASGGELSRIMLAIHCVLSSSDSIDTMIFDEIDAGVSGAASGKIATKLRSLGEENQVICVTHLPQIAAAADNHLKIEKKTFDDNTYTSVYKLSDEERALEIAGIISGESVSESMLGSAREMLLNYTEERNKNEDL